MDELLAKRITLMLSGYMPSEISEDESHLCHSAGFRYLSTTYASKLLGKLCIVITVPPEMSTVEFIDVFIPPITSSMRTPNKAQRDAAGATLEVLGPPRNISRNISQVKAWKARYARLKKGKRARAKAHWCTATQSRLQSVAAELDAAEISEDIRTSTEFMTVASAYRSTAGQVGEPDAESILSELCVMDGALQQALPQAARTQIISHQGVPDSRVTCDRLIVQDISGLVKPGFASQIDIKGGAEIKTTASYGGRGFLAFQPLLQQTTKKQTLSIQMAFDGKNYHKIWSISYPALTKVLGDKVLQVVEQQLVANMGKILCTDNQEYLIYERVYIPREPHFLRYRVSPLVHSANPQIPLTKALLAMGLSNPPPEEDETLPELRRTQQQYRRALNKATQAQATPPNVLHFDL